MNAPPTFAFVACDLDRLDALRADGAAIADLRARGDAEVLGFAAGKPILRAAPALAAVRAWDGSGSGAAGLEVFLGRTPEGAGVFAADLGPAPDFVSLGASGAEAFDLRLAAPKLSPRDAAHLGLGRWLLAWHADHGFCAKCGAASVPTFGGWRRRCPACTAEHYPRVNPVAIMRIEHPGGDALLLGRQAIWPAGTWSCLAGFVEPGESLEDAARRETREEAGVQVGRVDYLASQPWPFPGALMFGVHGQAISEAITVDGAELEAAMWCPRADLARMAQNAHATLRLPPKSAIARWMIDGWVEAGIN